jgi:hypothetical protein
MAIITYMKKQSLIEDLDEAKKKYRRALDKLADKPSSERRRYALACGRELMEMIAICQSYTGYNISVPHVSELSIQNDLQAGADSNPDDDD